MHAFLISPCALLFAFPVALVLGNDAGETCWAEDGSCTANDPTVLFQAPGQRQTAGPDAAIVTGADPPKKKVFFMHIAKTAGISVLKDLHLHVPNGTSIGTSECCWPAPRAARGMSVVTFMREPLAHVYSQWNMCNHNLDNSFKPEGLPNSFEAWLEYWARAGDGPGGDDTGFHCYIPINLQARVLSCTAAADKCPITTSALDRMVKTDASGELAVTERVALQRVEHESGGAAFVGLTEFYHESMCLIHVRYNGSFPPYCDCEDPEAWSEFPMTYYTHGSKGTRNVTLSQHEVDLVRKLTDVDLRIYRAAYARFMAELAEVEKRFGKKILCQSVTLAQEAQPDVRTVFLEQWDDE